MKDFCTLLERFTRRGVALVSVADSLDAGSAAGPLVLNIMTAVSQWEREAIGERYARVGTSRVELRPQPCACRSNPETSAILVSALHEQDDSAYCKDCA
jgi:hypothetical protein